MRLPDIIGLQADRLSYQKVIADANARLQAELEKFDAEKISKVTFLKRSKDILNASYKRAFLKGSGLTKVSAEGQEWLENFSEKQFGFLDAFATDIEAGAGKVEYDTRMGMYANAIQAAYWSGSIVGSDHPLNWITTANESCDDCLDMQSKNPWEPTDLMRVPGDGSTECKTHCKCRLVRSK